MKALRSIVLTALLAVPAQAQIAYLVDDITPQNPQGEIPAAEPFEFSAAGNRLVFAAGDQDHGNELWSSDGTVGGTEILSDSCPGDCGPSWQAMGSTRNLSFYAGEGVWRSDGTRAGTFPVLDQEPRAWALRGNVLFFASCDYTHDGSCALWRTDGTVAGTRTLIDLDVFHLALVGDRVLATTATELWRLDPGSETPVLLASPGNVYDFLAVVQNRLLLTVYDSAGEELWVSDGTAAGTRALTSFPDNNPFSHPMNFAANPRRLYFVADDIQHGNELWVSDGTPQGTKRISDIGYYFPFQFDLADTLQEAGDRVVFAATDGLSDDALQLWSTDGRPESTTLLLEPCSRECLTNPWRRVPYRTAQAGKVALFPAVDQDHGIELWSTDGTPSGTRLFKDLCPGSCDSDLAFIPSQGVAGIYFSTRNHIWWTDGTAAGTTRQNRQPIEWYDLLTPEIFTAGGKTYARLGSDDGGHLVLLENGEVRSLTFASAQGYDSEIHSLVAQGDRLRFITEGPGEYGLWQSDGTAGTTRFVSSDVRSMGSTFTAGGVVYFFDEYGEQLWRFTDGGALKIADITDGSGYSVGSAAALGSLLYFNMNRHGSWEIWKTDGTAAGTGPALTIPAGLGVGTVAASGGRLYLGLYGEGPDVRLWMSDGTAAGTREILNLAGYEGIGSRFVHLGGLDYFVTLTDYYLVRLWRTDGTAAGTLEVPLPTDAESVRLADGMIAHQGSLYVLGEDYHYPIGTSVLWKVDGNTADTAVRLRTFARHPERLLEIVSMGGLVLFTADDGEHGLELWATDGTPAGTRLVRDIAPGPFSSEPADFTVAGGRLFFSARDNAHGRELWQSDGTAAGTRLVHDISPGPASSQPRELSAGGSRLYFTADDGLTGRELWALPLSGPATCQPSDRALCLQGGRFRVEAVWRDFQLNGGAGTAVPLTGDAGYFWFFSPSNVEVILKVLDGRSLNDHFWVFYGALSNVEYTLTVTDTQTGLTLRYLNPMGQLASVGDTTGFGPQGAFSIAPPSPPALVRRSKSSVSAVCEPGPQRLCLGGGRFSVEADWKDFAGKTGTGKAVPLSADTGYFWFFDAANAEVVLKILDGTPVNGKHWVFYGALSNVEYTLTVTDHQTGEVRVYSNPKGRFASVADTGAF